MLADNNMAVNEKTWIANEFSLQYGDRKDEECIDLEKEIFLSGDGEDIPGSETFEEMADIYKKRNINLATILDAEGAYICIAPEPIARLIAKLLTEYETQIIK